jgi:hypothetical protein
LASARSSTRAKDRLRTISTKELSIVADGTVQMCSSRDLTPTLVFIVLVAACSAGKSPGGVDAAVDSGQADGQVDRAVGTDVLDTAGARDVAADLGDVLAERSSNADAQDAATLRDSASGDGAAEVGDVADDSRDANDARDSAVDTGVLRDAGKDLAAPVKDAAPEAAKLDGTADSPLPPAPNSCANPIDIPMDSPYTDLVLSTTGESHKFDLPCAQGGPDLVLRFALGEYSAVYADTFGATWNTILSFSTTCPPSPTAGNPDPGTSACSDDACNTTQSQAVALLPNQLYYLILSGANGDSGDVTVHFQHAGLGTGLVAALDPGTGSVSGTTITRTRGPIAACEASGPSASYWWLTCPDYLGGALTASTCTGTAFNTVLSLQIPRTGLVSCNDDYDPCGSRSFINPTVPPGAGLNVLTVGGATTSDYGDYLVTYTRP